MAHDELGPADIDRLADYIGGALHGPEAAAVARLISDDPRWRETYELLAPGMAAVGAELHALGAMDEHMPADLAARLDEAFASPGEPRLAPVGGDRHLSVVPDGTEPGRGSRVRSRRRRRMRWAVPVAAAAAVLAFAGIGIDYLAGQTGGSAEQATSAAGGNAEPMMGADSAGAASGVRDDQILETGTNYTAASLAAAPPPAASAMDRLAVPKAEASPDGRVAAPAAGDLDRLRAPDALRACIAAIAQSNGSGPITVETVDYARYVGRPALVVRFTAAGLTWVYAAGPNCGAPDRGAEVINRVQVR